MADNSPSLFRKLTQLFRSGPNIKRRVRAFDNSSNPQAGSSLQQFRKAHSDIYTNTMSAYGSFDRMSRYSDFSEMEATPEIASALDIYAEETSSVDDKGNVLHIYSENRKIRELLYTLFYDTLNVNFNLPMWVRNLCKYGDFFLFNDVSPEFGVIGAYPIPISEIEREEGYDPEDPTAVRFRWMTQGNQILENWQISHFRLLGNDAFLPYGSSVLESSRRIWRQLILIEDAMLVYRIIRAPERRVFKIDVGNVPPENVAEYLEQAKTSLKREPVVAKSDGRVDLRYNPLSVDEDYFIPVRGGDSGTDITSLAGGQNTSAIEDVEYIQKKLFAALKIPKAYLGYDEEIGSKATLAQEDIRFSRAISRIQMTVVSELNKIAMIHLFSHGYSSEDLIDFELKMSNPSSMAQQQKLELISTRFDIAAKVPEGIVDRRWVRKNVMGLTDEEIKYIEEGRVEDKARDAEVESGGESAAGGGGDEGGGDEGGLFAADIPSGPDILDGNPLAASDTGNFKEADSDEDEDEEDEDLISLSIDDENAPARVEKMIRNVWNEPLKRGRKDSRGPVATGMPDFKSMTSVGSKTRPRDTSNQPYDNSFFKNPFSESILKDMDMNLSSKPRLNPSIMSMLNKLPDVIVNSTREVLTEDSENNLDIELIDSLDSES
jgi:hypothetical protein